MKKIIKHLKENWIRHGFETLAVLIGVLAAFSLNNWNENRLKQTELDTYLLNLVENLESDVKLMNSLERVHIFRFHSLQYLIELAGEFPYDELADEMNSPSFSKNDIWEVPLPTDYDEEFIHLAFLWSHRLTNQNVNQSVINELKSTGMLSHLDNITLKNAINSYYKDWEHRIGESNQKKHEQIRGAYDQSEPSSP